MARVVIEISELVDNTASNSCKSADATITVELTSRIENNLEDSRSTPQNACFDAKTATLTFPDLKILLDEIAWLLEDHLIREPLATARADHARQLLYEHGSRLKQQLEIDEDDFLKHSINEVVFDIHDNDYLRVLLWETLESEGLWGDTLYVNVRRCVAQSQKPGLSKRSPANTQQQSKLKILLLVARKPGDTIDHQITSRLLIDMLETRPDLDEQIQLDICRPGSKNALMSAIQQNDYDILHLDLHGDVNEQGPCLLFQSSDPKSGEWVTAIELAAIISENRIENVVMNACRSAQSTVNVQNSLAASLVQSGVSCVVGMSYEVSDQAITVFHKAFYETLLDGGIDVASAASFARTALQREKYRISAMFGSEALIHDYIVPVVYCAGENSSRSLLPSSLQESREREAMSAVDHSLSAARAQRHCLGRITEAFEVENKLLNIGVALIEGPFGIGKRCLMEDLAAWFKRSGLVEAIYKVDCRGTVPTEEDCLRSCIKQTMGDAAPHMTTEAKDNDAGVYSLYDLLGIRPSVILLFDVEEQPLWMQILAEKIHSASDSNNLHTSFLVVSSRKSLAWLAKGLLSSNGWKPTCTLGSLDQVSSIYLLTTNYDDTASEIADSETAHAAQPLWYYSQLLLLLDNNPLATGLMSKCLNTMGVDEILLQLQVDKVPIAWEKNPKLMQLASSWNGLITNWGVLMLTLLPCQRSISRGLFTALFKCLNRDQSTSVGQFVESLIHAQAVSMVGRKGKFESFELLNLHPLLCQFIRYQLWNADMVHGVWMNVAAFYHNKCREWINAGLYSPNVVSGCKEEWQNMVAMLQYLNLLELSGESSEAALFDLPWLVCSFVAQNTTTSRLEKDLFLSLTVSAVQKMSPGFQVLDSYPWQLLFEVNVRQDSPITSELQLVRISFTCLHLIQSYYDASEITARDYNHLLVVMLGALDFGSFDQKFSEFLQTVLCYCMLIADELDVEDGVSDFGNKTSEFIESKHLDPSFKAFARTWNQTHVYRSLGYHSDLSKTRRAIEQSALANRIPMQEIQARIESLDDLKDAFEAINGDSSALTRGIKNLEKRLESAIANNDSRRQFDLYEKLVELYTKRKDWRAVLFVLDKIDELCNDLARFPGIRSDEISLLRRQLWMLPRRAVCLKRLGSIHESKSVVEQVRAAVKRREQLWTKADRKKEERRNMGAFLEREMAESDSDKDGDSLGIDIGDYSFMLQKFRTEGVKPSASAFRTSKLKAPETAVAASAKKEAVMSELKGLSGTEAPLLNPQEAKNAARIAQARFEALNLSDNNDASTSTDAVKSNPSGHGSSSSVEQATRIDTKAGEFIDDNDYENEDNDADNLYFVLNPWMKKPIQLLRKFALSAGGNEVNTFTDFRMPPGHVGGYFLFEGKRLVVEQYLRLIGVVGE